MKIACLQFAPQVGDIDNNLNRADAVLSRANVEDLLGLDLLVLPELAFSGTYPPPSLPPETHSLTSQATTSTPSGPSPLSSSRRALASARCGPAPRPCATTALSSSATPKRSM